MDNAVVHAHTADAIARYTAAPSHAVLLIGPHGLGKTHLAQHMAASVLGLEYDAIAQHPYYLRLAPDGSSISIEAIRALQRFLQLKTPGNGTAIRRAVIIEHADSLTTEAQNAFLKILEEPPEDTILLLTANNQRTLLPTILSRTQTIAITTPSEATVKAFFASHTDATTLQQAYFLSAGLPGLMSALIHNDKTHPLMSGVATAKTILQAKPFERLVMVESLSKNKEEAGYVLEALEHIAQTSIKTATSKADQARLKQWHGILKVTHAAREALQQNANPKLTLTHLMLHL